MIQPGDKFAWSQYAVPGTAAGFGLNFTDGTFAAGLPLVDQDGNPTTADGVTGRWHDRVVDLSSQAGKRISFTYFMTDGETAAGDWSVDYRDITFLRADGTVKSLYSGGAPGVNGTPGMTNLSTSGVTQGALGDVALTHYYAADHLGSTRMEFASGGWPVWSGDYAPYGQEISPQPTKNNYKFTGYERDGESGLDYAQARYYSSIVGRFISPDPSGLVYANPSNPQTFNLYSYVLNNPLKYKDPTGMYCYYGDTSGGLQQDIDNSSASQWDYHSSERECTSVDENGNQGQWTNDFATHYDSSSNDWVDDDGRPQGYDMGPADLAGLNNLFLGVGADGQAALFDNSVTPSVDVAIYATNTNYSRNSMNLGSPFLIGSLGTAHNNGVGVGFDLSASLHATIGYGSPSQLRGRSTTVSGNFAYWLELGGASLTYGGTFKQPYFQLTVSPPFAGVGFAAYFGRYTTTGCTAAASASSGWGC